MLNFKAVSAKTKEELLLLMDSRAAGLTSVQANQRLQQYGANAIVGKEIRWWQVLLRQFRSSFVYLLLAACLIAVGLGEFLDASFIFLFLLINASLGFFQEYRAEHALKILKKIIRKNTRVKRGGQEIQINVTEVVPGDIIVLRAGDMISADGYFLEAENVSVDESSLTGESVPAEKIAAALPEKAENFYEAKNIGFSQTTLLTGEAELLVFATGGATAIGDMAKAITQTKELSAFEAGMGRFSSFVLKLVLVIVPLVFLANFLIHRGGFNIGEFLIFSIALTVSVIPEALPLVTTLSITRGALRLTRMHVVPRRLSAIEDLGSIQILCTDKTGTITENHLRVEEILGDKETVIACALLASVQVAQAKQISVNVFDKALNEFLPNILKNRLSNIEVIDTEPFDPVRRKESVLVSEGKNYTLYTRGAPEFLFSEDFWKKEEDIRTWVKVQGENGKRVLAIACRHFLARPETIEKGFEENASCMGFVSFADPLKKTAKHAIEDAEKLGVRVKILTGDSKEVAGYVAYQAGIIKDPKDVMTGDEFDRLSLAEKHQAAENYDVFARTMPLQKYEIIQLLQEKYIVGFLGEGFNDAPALKLAHVALAVEGASDIAQDASDIILLNKSLEVIIQGIREGRKIFANTLKYIKATLTSNFGNFYALAFASLVIDYLPMLPLQILLLNLLSDFPMLSIAADSVDEEELKRPKGYNIREIALVAIILGLVSTAFDFAFFGFFVRYGASNLQTMWFIGSIFTELVLLFSIRTTYLFFKAKRPSFIVIGSTFLVMIFTVALPFTNWGRQFFSFQQPSGFFLAIAFGLVVFYFISTEVVKLLLRKFLNHNQV